jgi:hypothetical protein
MQTKYLIRKNIVLNGKKFFAGDTTEVDEKIAKKFPKIFEPLIHNYKKNKKKKNDRTGRLKRISENKR